MSPRIDRCGRQVTSHPVVAIAGVVVILGVIIIPIHNLRLGLPDASTTEAGSPAAASHPIGAHEGSFNGRSSRVLLVARVEHADPQDRALLSAPGA
jgi:uncharacterized membrane protein YdfJ with MMPL/SSD domain